MLRVVRLCCMQAVLAIALIAGLPASADSESESGTLKPTYEPRPPPEKEVYTTDYLFAITRDVSDYTLVPAAQVPLYFLTIPLDVAFLPIEAIAGFFPRE